MRVSLSLLVPLVASLAACLGIIAVLLLRERRRPGLPKADPLLGRVARVTQVNDGGRGGIALVNGELWQFVSSAPLAVGDEAVVDSLERMRIHLRKGE